MLTEFETVVKKGRDERGWCSDRALRHRTLRHALRVRAQLEALTSDVLDVAGFVVDDSETKLKSSDSIVRGWCSRKSLEKQRTLEKFSNINTRTQRSNTGTA